MAVGVYSTYAVLSKGIRRRDHEEAVSFPRLIPFAPRWYHRGGCPLERNQAPLWALSS